MSNTLTVKYFSGTRGQPEWVFTSDGDLIDHVVIELLSPRGPSDYSRIPFWFGSTDGYLSVEASVQDKPTGVSTNYAAIAVRRCETPGQPYWVVDWVHKTNDYLSESTTAMSNDNVDPDTEDMSLMGLVYHLFKEDEPIFTRGPLREPVKCDWCDAVIPKGGSSEGAVYWDPEADAFHATHCCVVCRALERAGLQDDQYAEDRGDHLSFLSENSVGGHLGRCCACSGDPRRPDRA